MFGVRAILRLLHVATAPCRPVVGARGRLYAGATLPVSVASGVTECAPPKQPFVLPSDATPVPVIEAGGDRARFYERVCDMLSTFGCVAMHVEPGVDFSEVMNDIALDLHRSNRQISLPFNHELYVANKPGVAARLSEYSAWLAGFMPTCPDLSYDVRTRGATAFEGVLVEHWRQPCGYSKPWQRAFAHWHNGIVLNVVPYGCRKCYVLRGVRPGDTDYTIALGVLGGPNCVIFAAGVSHEVYTDGFPFFGF